MEVSTRTRRTLSTALALVLAVETVSAVAVAATTTRPVTHEPSAVTPAAAVLAAGATAGPAAGRAFELSVVASTSRDIARVVEPSAVAQPAPDAAAAVEAARAAAAATDRRPEASDTAVAVSGGRSKGDATPDAPKPDKTAPSSKPSYRGTNHVWFPALGINRSVRWFPCDRARDPDNYVYRWGCSGANNVYLMGHAHSVMEPLHDAYVSGRLAKGMKVWYADPNGRVRVYSIRWWKVTRPTTDAAWAWAAQDVPSMTLQTCVGKNSEYRLMVRLVEVGR